MGEGSAAATKAFVGVDKTAKSGEDDSVARGGREGEEGKGEAPVNVCVDRVDVGANKLARATISFRAPAGVGRVDQVWCLGFRVQGLGFQPSAGVGRVDQV